jgi:uroporphyrinogen decarboxylase
MQSGLLISPDIFEEFFAAQHKRLIDLVKSHGIKVFHHDDGAIRPLIPRLIDLGIDVLNPIQWKLPGMNPEGLKREFGARICFHGGVDNQETLPFGSKKDIENEVLYLLNTLAADHTGYIIAPCHNIQPITPVENIIAMYEAIGYYGRF